MQRLQDVPKVKNSEGKETVFKLKKTTALRKMMDAYCQREGLPMDGVSPGALGVVDQGPS